MITAPGRVTLHTLALTRSTRRGTDLLVAGALAVAGAIHLVLTPEHFSRSALLGAAFASIAATQLGVAVTLVRRPGARTYRAALLASLGLLVAWALTRFFTPPTGAAPEDVDAWGVAAAGLELGAVVLLASTVPSGARVARRRGFWAVAAGAGFAVVFLLASGSAGSAPGEPGAPFVEAYTLTGEFSVTVPGVVLYLDHGRVFLTLPWSTGVFLPIAVALVGAQVYLALGSRACSTRLRARRRGTLSAVPALFAAPVCCGAPLLSFLGAGAVLSVAAVTPGLLAASCLLMGLSVWRLRSGQPEIDREPASSVTAHA